MSGAERMVGGGLTRRGLLGAASATVVLGACSGSKTGQESGSTPSAPSRPERYAESPMLAARVKSGALRPVAERLPKEPYVVRPGVLIDDSVVGLKPGKYGGTFRGAGRDIKGLCEFLLWAPGGFANPGTAIVGDVLAGYEVNGDNSVFTFHMREGLRWSDGEPVTSADVRFAFEDVLGHAKVTPLFPTFLRAGLRTDRAPAKLTVIDDWTFSLTFDAAYGTFPVQIASGGFRDYSTVIKPRHYLEQFHEKYASAAKLQQELKKASLPKDQWFALFNAKQLTGWWAYSADAFIDHPVLYPWVLASAQAQANHYERNPYYFKVDSEGNQLPYIDTVRHQLVDERTSFSQTLMGASDQAESLDMREISLLAEKAEKGEGTLLIGRCLAISGTYIFNLTHLDRVWRQVVRDLRFRQALSMAINREEIIESFYLGEFAELPTQSNPSTYDPDGANRLLDEMGLDAKDAEGYRLGPDGKRFTIPFEYFALWPDYGSRAELVAEYWKRVGVYTTVRQISPDLWGRRLGANELKATVLQTFEPDIWKSATWTDYLPALWGPLWQKWYDTQGKEGEEPIPEVKQLFELHGQFLEAEVDSDESNAALNSILKSWRDNIWVFLPAEHTYSAGFMSKRIRNAPSGTKKEVVAVLGDFSTEQFYIED